MGLCFAKEKIKIIEGEVINEVDYNYDPKNPVDDIQNKFIWVSLHTSDKNFSIVQEKGFCIVGNKEINALSRVWMRQKRNKPI